MVATAPRKRHGILRWIFSGGGLFLLVVLFQAYSALSQPSPVSCSQPSCTAPPPKQQPIPPPSHYTSSKYGFSLEYSTENITPSQTTSDSISWDGQLSDGSEVSWTVLGGLAGGKTPDQIVSDIQNKNFPDAQAAYNIPDASVGYTLGSGTIYDVNIAPANGQAVHDRLVVMAAVKNGLAVVIVGYGPYQRSDPKTADHPDPANTPLVSLADFEETAMSVTWPGDKPL